jgi:hypothetical protein
MQQVAFLCIATTQHAAGHRSSQGMAELSEPENTSLLDVLAISTVSELVF